MKSTKDSNIVKIAVLPLPDTATQDAAQLIEFDQKRPLAAIIQDLCGGWNLSEPEQYALQFSDNELKNYITEKNRNEIKNGNVLRLTHSPCKTAQNILDKLTKGSFDDKKDALKQLTTLAADVTFAEEFINKQGSTMLISHLEKGTYSGDALSSALASFVQLMDHSIVFWDVLQPEFIKKIATYVNNQAASQEPQTLEASLAILECVVLNSTSKYFIVEQEVTLPNLTLHLQSPNSEIQQNAIALINALFTKAETTKRKSMAMTLSSRHIRNIIVTSVIQGSRPVGAEMAHQLYVLQTLQLNLLEDRKCTKIDPQDQDAMTKILELRRIAFESDDVGSRDVPAKRQGGYGKDYKRLGFKNHTNPAEDFAETPPGVLALDNMVYFARTHTDSYTKVVLENSCRADEHECPFGSTSIELTKLLCEILKIGEHPTDQGQMFYPMFFTHDHPFEEFFCICIVLLNKTWKEMRATTEDFVKVFSVVREQITRALSQVPAPATLDVLKTRLNALTYNEITCLWQQERSNREEWESQAKPVVELREQITPEIVELIQRQRLAFLVEGTMFTKYNAKGVRTKDKFWYCRLAPNHKMLHYGDCYENSVPTLEQLQNKISVVDIKALITGKDCPHMKDKRVIKSVPLAFSLLLDTEQASLDFVASCDKDFDYWTDGINSLLGAKMTSREMKADLEMLLSMDIKLRLLDTEGVKLPENPPPIPKDPPNYDFYYEYK